ncbi:sirohydrochlorin chelatase [Thiorhodovibrio winogradskyi]|nr:CbiX/SirB N-terminal domain-containing protein [Thiorhodovibrio winogradskyi]
MPNILLVDNGSKRADATLSLRELATRLQARAADPVEPVSLLHSDAIPPHQLNDQPARTLAPYLRRQLESGQRDFLIVPLFFGASRALTSFIPETAAALRRDFDDFRLRIAPPLCPLPRGEPRLVEILVDNLAQCRLQASRSPEHVFLVDHGSPIARVTAVRNWLAKQLVRRLGDRVGLTEAAMERRPGREYDFNGPLLSDALATHARAHPRARVAVAMQFLAAGRHAGPDGDVVTICRDIEARHPGFSISLSPLMSTHPLLIDILIDRMHAEHRDGNDSA